MSNIFIKILLWRIGHVKLKCCTFCNIFMIDEIGFVLATIERHTFDVYVLIRSIRCKDGKVFARRKMYHGFLNEGLPIA